MFPRNKVLNMSPEKTFLEEFIPHPVYTTNRVSRNQLVSPHQSETSLEREVQLKHCCSTTRRFGGFCTVKVLERSLWVCTFTGCVSIAAYMINAVWTQYYDNPVIVTSNPTEYSIEDIPFPAVTICSMNPFSKARVHEYEKKYQNAKSEMEKSAALNALQVINGICSSQQSFMKSRGFARKRGFIMIPEAKEESNSYINNQITDFLMNNTQNCDQLLRLCKWDGEEHECRNLFRPILTDFGMCCTFNGLPRQTMLREIKTLNEPTKYKENPFWNASEIAEWSKWKYRDSLTVKDGLKYPYTQQKAGMQYGLSVLVDPDVENNFCPASDSEGIKILLHSPIEPARVADLGSIVGLNREAFLQVFPDLTVSHPGIADFEAKTRNCFFGRKFKLDFFKPYTKANCQEECWNKILNEMCNCVMYYAPRKLNTNVCGLSPNSKDYQCVKAAEVKYHTSLDKQCRHCMQSCNYLGYSFGETSAMLQPRDILLNSSKNDTETSDDAQNGTWTDHKLSIVHIYMGSDTVVPKLRRKLYNTIDLIANTGGLLGLSLGFSILSAVQVIYKLIIYIIKTGYRRCLHYHHSKVHLHGRLSGDYRRERRMLIPSLSNATQNIAASGISTPEGHYDSIYSTSGCKRCTCFKL